MTHSMIRYYIKSLILAYFQACKLGQRKLRYFDPDINVIRKRVPEQTLLHIAVHLVIPCYCVTATEKGKIKDTHSLQNTQSLHPFAFPCLNIMDFR